MIKPIFPEKIQIRVYLMIVLVVQVLKRVGAQFALLSFKPRRISFVVCFITPSKVLIIFGFMGTIVFYTLSFLNST